MDQQKQVLTQPEILIKPSLPAEGVDCVEANELRVLPHTKRSYAELEKKLDDMIAQFNQLEEEVQMVLPRP